MKLFNAFIAIFFASVFSMQAQDLHYSQYFVPNMNFNPALTGRFAHDYQFTGIHRNQWSGIDAAFVTTSIGAERNFKGGKLNHDKAGAGIYFTNDNIGEKALTSQSLNFSGSYHRALDAHKKVHLSGGLQLGLVMKSVNMDKLSFETQYQDFVFNPDLANGENTNSQTIFYPDVRAGLFGDYKLTDKILLNIGASFFNINAPQESFYKLSDQKNKLNLRSVFTAGLDFHPYRFLTISPKFLYMYQSKAKDINVGAEGIYQLPRNTQLKIHAGLFTRFSDAAIILGGISFKNYTCRISYDATISSLQDVKTVNNLTSTRTGAWEISIIYKGFLKKHIPSSYQVPCGIF